MLQTRCTSCGSLAAPNDTACRRCGSVLPFGATVPSGEIPPAPPAVPTDAEIAALTEELREALAPRIVLLQQLGEGGMGRVFLAREPALRRLVAVKVLNPALVGDSVAQARFAREAETAAAVGHPGVVGIYQVGELPKSRSAYFVMQFVEGTSLEQEIKPGEGLPAGKVQRIVGEVASALAAAHARGLVHRDIKPANIMLDGETGRVVVLDFGISAVLDRGTPGTSSGNKLTVEGTAIGTPMYMSPEQGLAQQVTAESDIYSLGVVAFELATGKAPFSGTSWGELIAAHIKDAPPSVASLRPDLEGPVAELIDRCLAKEPARRPSAVDLARGLLPSAQTLIEWPPPGLARLRGLLLPLFTALGGVAGLVLLFELILWRQPGFATLRERGGSDGGFDVVPIWLFALAVCVVLVGLLVPVVGVRVGRLVEQWRWGRDAGYPRRVLFDVAWDHRTDLGHLLNGTGPFLLLEASIRERLRRQRRRGALVIGTSLTLSMLWPALWVSGILGGWTTGTTKLLPGAELITMLSPLIVGIVAFVWVGMDERRLTRSTRGIRRWRLRQTRPTLQPGLVTSWLAAAAQPARGRSWNVPSLVIEAVPFALALLAAGTAALVLLYGYFSKQQVDRYRPAAEALLAASTTDSLHWQSWQTLDSIVGASAIPVDPSQPPDLAAAKALLAMTLAGDSLAAWWSVDRDEVPRVDTLPPVRTLFWDRVHVAEALPLRPGRAALDSLSADTLSPGLPLWRRLARSSPLPPLWKFREGLVGMRGSWDLPSYFSPGGDQADRNMIASTLALVNGDPRTALLRVRENIAAGRALLRSPEIGEWRAGRRAIISAIRPMREIARVTGDRALAAEADRLEAVLARNRTDAYAIRTGWLGLVADPRAPEWGALLADTTMPAAFRMEGMRRISFGFCASPREILFGVDPRRRDALDRAAQALHDIPGSVELIDLERRTLDKLIDRPADLITDAGDDAPWPARLGLQVARVMVCQGG